MRRIKGGRNGSAESRKVFQQPPERTALTDTSPPDSGMIFFRVFRGFLFLRSSAFFCGKEKTPSLHLFVSPC